MDKWLFICIAICVSATAIESGYEAYLKNQKELAVLKCVPK